MTQAPVVFSEDQAAAFDAVTDLLRSSVRERCEEGQLTAGQLDYSLPAPVFLHELATRLVSLITDEGALGLYRLCVNEGERQPDRQAIQRQDG